MPSDSSAAAFDAQNSSARTLEFDDYLFNLFPKAYDCDRSRPLIRGLRKSFFDSPKTPLTQGAINTLYHPQNRSFIYGLIQYFLDDLKCIREKIRKKDYLDYSLIMKSYVSCHSPLALWLKALDRVYQWDFRVLGFDFDIADTPLVFNDSELSIFHVKTPVKDITSFDSAQERSRAIRDAYLLILQKLGFEVVSLKDQYGHSFPCYDYSLTYSELYSPFKEKMRDILGGIKTPDYEIAYIHAYLKHYQSNHRFVLDLFRRMKLVHSRDSALRMKRRCVPDYLRAMTDFDGPLVFGALSGCAYHFYTDYPSGHFI